VSPPWCAETHLQGRYRIHAPDRRRCADERHRNYGRPTTGGLRPPLLVVHAFVHRKSRHFTGKRSRIQTGAAGVSPPWIWEVHL
jgi:hypothetical protein